MIFRIRIRKWSSNIIEASEDGGESWVPYIAPLIKKADGDEICRQLIKIL